jgi:hypothetical protein
MTRRYEVETLMTCGEKTEVPNSVLERLAAHAATLGIDPDPVLAMHQLVDFSDPPAGYIRRLSTLNSIAAIQISNRMFAEVWPELATWMPYIAEVLRKPAEFADVTGLLGEERRRFLLADGQDPLRGIGMKKHQLEALLWTEVQDQGKEENTRYLLLQGQMIIAQASILQIAYTFAATEGAQIPEPVVLRSLNEPNLFARRFANERWLGALRHLPLIAEATEYAKGLETLRKNLRNGTTEDESEIPEKVDETLAGIVSHIGRGQEKQAYEKRAFNGRNSEHRSESKGENEFTITSGSNATRIELEKDGECPEDHLRTRTFILADSEVAVSHQLAAKARENQMLPRRYREPHPGEYALLIGQMQAHPEQFKSPLEAKEVIAWTQTVFFYGCSPKQAASLLVGFPDTPLADCDFMLRLAKSQEGDQIFPPRMRVRALEPEYKTPYIRIEGERERVWYFELADLAGVCNSIRDLLSELQRGADQSDVSPEAIRTCAMKIFSQKADTYEEIVNGFAASIGLGDRVAVSGLGKVLFQRYVEAGDVVSAALLTCDHPTLASVRRWYFSPSVNFLRCVHRLGVESVVAQLPKGFSVLGGVPALGNSTEYVGSRRCAEFEFIRTRVEILQCMVKGPVAVRSIQERRRAFTSKHNALTMLAIWAVDLSVGMRSSTRPYLHASKYDRTTGMGSLWDKGIKKARPFCLSELAMCIAEAHDRYLAQLERYGLPPSTKARPCYFVDEDLNIVPVTPGSIEKYFGNFFLFAPNWARRMVKTMAIERGIPAIFTDAYCGHSNYGREPFYTFSSFDPLPYFVCMRRFLGQLLADLGFKPLSFDPAFLEAR